MNDIYFTHGIFMKCTIIMIVIFVKYTVKLPVISSVLL